MANDYMLEEMVNLLHAPIHLVNNNKKIENMDNELKINAFMRNIEMDFIEEVRKVKKSKNNNYLIKKTENYIFQHLHNKISIAEIANYLSFSSQSHFGKCFKEITGITPNEYRKKYVFTKN